MADTSVAIVTNMVTPYTNNLYNELHDGGMKLSLIACSRREPNRRWDVEGARYPHQVLSGLVLKLGAGRFAHLNWGLWKALRRARPRLVFINGFYPTMVLAAVWARLNRVKLALTIDGWAETMPNSLYHRLVRPVILSWCQVVIVPGRKGREYFLAHGFSAEQIFCVPLVPAWAPPAHIPAFGERPFHLFWCAHLNKTVKNVGFFLSVVEDLKRRVPELRVRVVGSGEAEGELIQRLDGAGVAYRHDRYVPWSEMAGVYATVRVLALSSLWEPWGLVCDEALSCGVPCVVSNHVGAGDDAVTSEINGHVLNLDVQAWTSVISDIVLNPETWWKLSCSARRIADERSVPLSAMSFKRAVEAAVT